MNFCTDRNHPLINPNSMTASSYHSASYQPHSTNSYRTSTLYLHRALHQSHAPKFALYSPALKILGTSSLTPRPLFQPPNNPVYAAPKIDHNKDNNERKKKKKSTNWRTQITICFGQEILTVHKNALYRISNLLSPTSFQMHSQAFIPILSCSVGSELRYTSAHYRNCILHTAFHRPHIQSISQYTPTMDQPREQWCHPPNRIVHNPSNTQLNIKLVIPVTTNGGSTRTAHPF